jgi:hypothetical protein
MLLYTHVTELQPLAQLIDRKSLRFLQSFNDPHSLRTANFTYPFHSIRFLSGNCEIAGYLPTFTIE